MQTERSTFSNALYIQNSPRSYTDLSIAHLSDEATMPYSLWLCLPVQCLCSWRGGEERFTSNLQGSGSYIQQINPHLGLHASWPIECTNKHSKRMCTFAEGSIVFLYSVPSCDESTPQSHMRCSCTVRSILQWWKISTVSIPYEDLRLKFDCNCAIVP